MTRKKKAAATEERPKWMLSAKLIKFITELEKHGNVTEALRGAKAARGWLYRWREKDADFREAFDAARKCGLEVLKDEAHRRAFGFKEPVYTMRKGKRVKVGDVSRYSDTLLMFLIKQSDPSYRESFRIDHGNAEGRPFMFSMQLHPQGIPSNGNSD